MKIKKLKKIEILGTPFKIVWDQGSTDASFSYYEQLIRIGCEHIEKDPNYIFSLIMHEISELLHVILSTRYRDGNIENNYKFFMDHKEFSNHNLLLSSYITKFLI